MTRNTVDEAPQNEGLGLRSAAVNARAKHPRRARGRVASERIDKVEISAGPSSQLFDNELVDASLKRLNLRNVDNCKSTRSSLFLQ